jgi:hypothetical protein
VSSPSEVGASLRRPVVSLERSGQSAIGRPSIKAEAPECVFQQALPRAKSIGV